MMRAPLLLVVLGGCGLDSDIGLEDTGPTQVEQAFPLPDDLDKIVWETVFTDAVNLLVTVNTQGPFAAHRSTMVTRQLGCPDFYTGEFTVGLMTVGDTDGVSWFDDCLTPDGTYYDGHLWWETDVQEYGDPKTDDGRTSDAYRRMEGDALVGDPEGVRLEFDGEATDSFYRLEAYGYERFVYSTTIDGTITGRDVFEGSLTPNGYRTDLFMYMTGGDIDVFQARGNVYMFSAQLQDRFDSIEVDMAMVGPAGAAPGDCTLEPLGWIGVRDPNAYWYDVVFQPRAEEDIVGDQFVDPELSACDGCGRLYVQGVEQVDVDVCIDFSFLFADGGFPLPDADDFVLPIHSL